MPNKCSRFKGYCTLANKEGECRVNTCEYEDLTSSIPDYDSGASLLKQQSCDASEEEDERSKQSREDV